LAALKELTEPMVVLLKLSVASLAKVFIVAFAASNLLAIKQGVIQTVWGFLKQLVFSGLISQSQNKLINQPARISIALKPTLGSCFSQRDSIRMN
jgi:hypothetical protein